MERKLEFSNVKPISEKAIILQATAVALGKGEEIKRCETPKHCHKHHLQCEEGTGIRTYQANCTKPSQITFTVW